MKMNRVWRLAVFAILCVAVGRGFGLGVGVGWGQTFGADVGDVFLSGSESFYQQNLLVGSFTPFNFYIVADIDYADIGAAEQNLSNGISGWEMGVSIPADIIITQAQPNPANALPIPGSPTNLAIGLGTTFAASTSPILLFTYTGLITNPVTPENLILRVGGFDPSTFDPAVPGFLDGEISGECFLPDSTPAKCKRKFARAKGMTVNWRVPVETPSWSDVKSRFGG